MSVSAEVWALECRLLRAAVPLALVLSRAEVDRSTWSRWRAEKNGPTLSKWRAVLQAVDDLISASDRTDKLKTFAADFVATAFRRPLNDEMRPSAVE